MKLYSVVCMVMLAATVVGCDAKKHMEDVGFKQGENVVEKGTIKYDTLVDKDEACTAAWADYESNLQRRADMIPQLVSVVRASAAHEETTLIAVTQARADATKPEIKLDPKSGDLEDPAKFAAFQQAQSTLGTTMSRLMVANENYPTLAASPQFHDLQIQIEGTENRLLRSREQYNKAVLDFNTELRHVSGKIMNPITGHEFMPKQYFHADSDAKQPPKLDFGTPAGATAVKPAGSK